MKLTLQHCNVPSTHELDSILEEGIFELQPRVKIDEARVQMECCWEESPSYRVGIYIVTPGPDIQAEGRDHTIRAAIRMALNDLEKRLRARERKPLQRLRSNVQLPAARRGGRLRR